MAVTFPDGKRFAFTIFDDTDVGTLESLRPIYDLLAQLGLRTTKTVWPLDYLGSSAFAGSVTLEDPQYCDYLRTLQSQGFEIAFHGATMETALRADTARALESFRNVFGHAPTSYAAHSHNRDNLYWGRHRFHSPLWRALYAATAGRGEPEYSGHVAGSDVYWLDLAPELRYVRSFTFAGVDLDKVTRRFPYSTAQTPRIKGWFPSCDADNVQEFVELLSDENQSALESGRGICILSTHLGKGFVRNGRVREDVVRVLESLSRRSGWFVPLTTLLDYVAAQRGISRLSRWQLFSMEGLWFLHTFRRRRTRRDYERSEAPYLIAAQEARQARLQRGSG
jgi:hypothetical protein